MGSFSREQPVQATRKLHYCAGCHMKIATGSPAMRCSGLYEGSFYSYIYHVDCREAEVALNKDTMHWRDEWSCLDDFSVDDWYDGMRHKFPIVAIRMGTGFASEVYRAGEGAVV